MTFVTTPNKSIDSNMHGTGVGSTVAAVSAVGSSAVGEEDVLGVREDSDICCIVFYWLGHYILHIASHILAWNYLFIFILFKDAQENKAYMIDDVREWSDINLIIACTMFYSIVNLQAIYLSCVHSRHILPCVIAAMFYGLCYLSLCLGDISGCDERLMLDCPDDGSPLSNHVIDMSITFTRWAMVALTLWISVYILSVIRYNQGRIYYHSRNCLKETIMLFVLYYLCGLVIFVLPACCFCLLGVDIGGDGGEDLINLGDYVNGNAIDDSIV